MTRQGRQIFTSCESSPGRSAPQKRGPPDSASGQKKIGIVCKSFSAFYRKKSCLRKDTTSQAYNKISFLRLASFPQSGEARAFPPLPRLLNHSCCLQVKKLGDIYYNEKGQVRDTTHTCPLRLFKKVDSPFQSREVQAFPPLPRLFNHSLEPAGLTARRSLSFCASLPQKYSLCKRRIL